MVERKMKIVVLIKQVPATDKVKMDEATGTMIRDGVESEVNPLDLYAVEEAVRIKERSGGGVEIHVLSMGPRKAEEAVRSAMALGCDYGYLLSDRKFAGSDTWATAYTLSETLRRKLAPFDLILCGERATDGETGQVGPEVGTYLNLPVLTYVRKIETLREDAVMVQRAVEGGHEVIEAPLPALISVVKEINHPRLPNFSGKMRAKKAEIPVWTAEDLGVDESRLGLKGSPTRVVKIFRPQVARKGKIVSAREDLEGAVVGLVDFLREKALL